MKENLSTVAADSHLWRVTTAMAQGVLKTWRSSRFGRTLKRGTVIWTARPPAERLRFGAAVVAWALIWLLAGQRWLPPYAGSGLPQMWFASAAIVAALVSLAATPLVRAWGDSRLARLARSTRRGI